jgi:TfoX/Sxy family transcriptional regulator of competence genes
VAYDEDLADRVRVLLAGRTGVREQKMFGGLCFMLNGNMACGVMRGELIVRVGKENTEDALSQPHSRPFDMTGRPMRSFVCVTAEGIATDEGLAAWAGRGIAYAEALAPK